MFFERTAAIIEERFALSMWSFTHTILRRCRLAFNVPFGNIAHEPSGRNLPFSSDPSLGPIDIWRKADQYSTAKFLVIFASSRYANHVASSVYTTGLAAVPEMSLLIPRHGQKGESRYVRADWTPPDLRATCNQPWAEQKLFKQLQPSSAVR